MISHSLRASSGVAPLLSSLCTSSSRLNLAAIRSASSTIEDLAVFTTTSVLVVTLICLATTYLLERMSIINAHCFLTTFWSKFIEILYCGISSSVSVHYSTFRVRNSSDLNNTFIIFLCVKQ